MNKDLIKFSSGLLFIIIFSTLSIWLAASPLLAQLGISPLIVAIILGIIYGNTIHHKLTSHWHKSLSFCTKRILRMAIVLYGFRISFQELMGIGWQGIGLGCFVVISTLALGIWVGKKLKIDQELSLLISAGAAICGAAAVLATEGVLRSNPYKTAVAVASVVLLGTLAMFLYPILQNIGWLNFTAENYGIYSGATIYEVAQVIVAGSAAGVVAGKLAVITKMLRVMLLAPYLIFLNQLRKKTAGSLQKTKLVIPWFALGFIAMIGFNSLQLLPATFVARINEFDTFLLVMAMAALGVETQFSKMKGIGLNPLCLALILFSWLTLGIYLICRAFL